MERNRFELTYEESGVLWQSNSGCEGHQLDPGTLEFIATAFLR
jgi:hypothetical protein